ncbi:MAG: AraC family transcriptional regulator ligand-binding domain-containing protein [Bacteroidia bacterium]|nr:AraC family transcriptional regulator ligand-binding domain-containing protein [Bacteroidia bacterium]
MKQKLISKSLFNSWLQFAAQQGHDTSSILQHLQIPETEQMIPFSKFANFAQWLMQKSGNSQIGYSLGRQSSLAAMGMVGQLIQSSRNIREGLEHACKFFNLLSEVLSLKLEEGEKYASLIFELDKESVQDFPEVCQQLLLTSMIFSFKEVYFLTLQKAYPQQVDITFAPIHQKEMEALFQCQIRAKSNRNLMGFEKEVLDQKIFFADYELMLHLEKLACHRLGKQMENQQEFSDKIKALVYTLLDPSFPSLKSVSLQLGMSERNIQRKLKEENTSYSSLITEMKKSMATAFLDKKLSIKETTYLLGYSEPSAFIHAFISWFGISPKNYQNQQIA